MCKNDIKCKYMFHFPLKNLARKGLKRPGSFDPKLATSLMGLLPDTQNCGLRMPRECRERFPRHRLQRKPLVSDPGMHHGTCVTHVPWCMSGSFTRAGGENVSGIPGACATRNFTCLARGPLLCLQMPQPPVGTMLRVQLDFYDVMEIGQWWFRSWFVA